MNDGVKLGSKLGSFWEVNWEVKLGSKPMEIKFLKIKIAYI